MDSIHLAHSMNQNPPKITELLNRKYLRRWSALTKWRICTKKPTQSLTNIYQLPRRNMESFAWKTNKSTKNFFYMFISKMHVSTMNTCQKNQPFLFISVGVLFKLQINNKQQINASHSNDLHLPFCIADFIAWRQHTEFINNLTTYLISMKNSLDRNLPKNCFLLRMLGKNARLIYRT